jgi:hypothetical protein
LASILNCTFAVCDRAKLIITWPVEVSAGVVKLWFAPLFGHSIALPPEAAESLTTTKGENRLWPERFSSSTTNEAPPLVLLLEDELELLEDDELLLEEELLEELELDELLLEDDDELLELDEDDELLLEPPLPTHAGAIKLPSWLPCTPKAFAAVWPGAGNCQLQQLVNWKLVPGLVPVRVAFHWVEIVTCSGKFRLTVQLLRAVVPLLVTLTSTWKKVPPVFEGVAVQVYAANP